MGNEITNDILLKAQEGDLDSFEIIYRTCVNFVYNVAYRILCNKEDAEEVTQEVFLNVYHKLKGFRLESSFKTWVYRITVNCAINYQKKMARERERQKRYDDNLGPEGHVNDPGVAINSENRERTINALLRILNPDQRTAIVLRNIEGLSYREIADTLKVSINTVRSRLKRAREKMLVIRKEVIKNEM